MRPIGSNNLLNYVVWYHEEKSRKVLSGQSLPKDIARN